MGRKSRKLSHTNSWIWLMLSLEDTVFCMGAPSARLNAWTRSSEDLTEPHNHHQPFLPLSSQCISCQGRLVVLYVICIWREQTRNWNDCALSQRLGQQQNGAFHRPWPARICCSSRWSRICFENFALKRLASRTKLCHFAPPPPWRGRGAKWQSFVRKLALPCCFNWLQCKFGIMILAWESMDLISAAVAVCLSTKSVQNEGCRHLNIKYSIKVIWRSACLSILQKDLNPMLFQCHCLGGSNEDSFSLWPCLPLRFKRSALLFGGCPCLGCPRKKRENPDPLRWGLVCHPLSRRRPTFAQWQQLLTLSFPQLCEMKQS